MVVGVCSVASESVPVKILLYGPPGVGKTSIADVMADAHSGSASPILRT